MATQASDGAAPAVQKEQLRFSRERSAELRSVAVASIDDGIKVSPMRGTSDAHCVKDIRILPLARSPACGVLADVPVRCFDRVARGLPPMDPRILWLAARCVIRGSHVR